MKIMTVTLKDGPNVCELRPFDDGQGFNQARVVGGEVGRRGDVVLKPADLTWEEASEEVAPGRTTLSPFDLELVQDVVTHVSYLPEGGLETLCKLSEEFATGPDSTIEEAQYNEALSRLLAEADSAPGRKVDPGLRRRKVGAA